MAITAHGNLIGALEWTYQKLYSRSVKPRLDMKTQLLCAKLAFTPLAA